MVKAYYEKDADLKLLKGKTVGIIGYGNQGHAQALNLRDSGVDVIICELPGTDAYEAAKKAKFKIVTAEEMAQKDEDAAFPPAIQPQVPDALLHVPWQRGISRP